MAGVSSLIDSWESISFNTVEGMTLSFKWSLMFYKLFIHIPSFKAKASNFLIFFRMLVFNKIIGPLAILS